MLSFVVDGSFGWRDGEIDNAVEELRNAGHDVWLHLYVYNGPAQRRWRSGVFKSFAVMDPLVFRHGMVHDPHLQDAYRDVVRSRILPAVQFASGIGAKVSIAPGLEDNLDDAGYRVSLRLLKEILPRSIPVSYVRSSCYQCQRGTGRFRPKGVMLEEHDDRLFPNRWDGIINTDGRYFSFSTESSPFPRLAELVEPWILRAEKQRNAFLLWIPHFQDAPPGLIPTALDERNFRGPSDAESREIIEFLRSGG